MLSRRIFILSFLSAVPTAAGAITANINFNYEIILNETVVGRSLANNPASYEIEFTNYWTEERHPFRFPTGRNPHWSSMVLASHSESYTMWCEGCTATSGIESIAEVGSTSTLTNELGNQVEANTVLDVVVGASPTGNIINTTKINDEICLNRHYPFISAISMIAPSPDWFSGLYNLPLVKRGRWYDKLSVYIHAWDAGTEQGDDFTFNNEPTSPLDEIKPFTTEGSSDLFVSMDENQNKRVLPVGMLTFTRIAASSDCVLMSDESKPETFVVRQRRGNREVTCAWIGRRIIKKCYMTTVNSDGSVGPKVSELCPITCRI